MKTILCPVDFSTGSSLAAEWAVMLAVRRKWKLVLFNKFFIYAQGHKESDNPLDKRRKETEAQLLAMKEQLCMKYKAENLECDIDMDFGIETEEVILRAARKANAEMIVMGTKGAESFSDIIGGSNASNVINETNIPVLVIPDGVEARLPDSFVYATDLKDEDSANLSYILDLANDLQAKITFLHVIKEGGASKLARLKEIISEQLTRLAPKVPSDKLTYDEIASNNMYQAISDYSKSNGVGMVILGRHPKNFLEKLVEGNFTRMMALYSFTPVLIVHKKD